MEFPGNPSPACHNYNYVENVDPFDFEHLSDYVVPGDDPCWDEVGAEYGMETSTSSMMFGDNLSGVARHTTEGEPSNNIKHAKLLKEKKIERGTRVAFKTKSETEIMDDGYKWRKYGKKYIKNTPNPRNYYKCSSEGCKVKKRVERDREDYDYVITAYDGVHNHPIPSYPISHPFPALQPDSNSSSSS